MLEARESLYAVHTSERVLMSLEQWCTRKPMKVHAEGWLESVSGFHGGPDSPHTFQIARSAFDSSTMARLQHSDNGDIP